MPWKLLAFIAVMTVVLVFVGVNLGNSCDISVVFITFDKVPVVITILGSFLLGLLAAFFLALGRNKHTTTRITAKPASGGKKSGNRPHKPDPADKPSTAETGS
ncbi:MAG: DUF1049 domain-containing protein [Spirochaetales bacterium]|nr:MAG: DUF1049 domain-containing protein [Spirochaetales bacterium]